LTPEAGPGTLAAPPLWTALPFVAYLLTIAVGPLAFPHFWEHHRNKLILGAMASAPVALYLLLVEPHGLEWLHHALREYVGFIALLASLFIIAGGIYVRGSLQGTPLANTALLAIGAVLASFIGTTGASMLLIRPLLRANEKRRRRVQIVVFFIFIVSNGAGMLTPLGDPPLFLGFLRGVPFLWTLQLFWPWMLVNGALLVLFNLLDQRVLARDEQELPGSQLEEAMQVKEPLRIDGAVNFIWLFGVIAIIYAIGRFGAPIGSGDARALLQIGGMLGMAGLSLLTTSRASRAANQFAWGPIVEVAAIFLGIFVTMVPALKLLEARGAELGVTQPWQYFWASGMLSSFLDNAPTYLTFASMAVGAVNAMDPSAHLTADDLGGLVHHPAGALLLIAISCGAVFMGANTYIGNGPNFMVKAIAESSGVRMPSFFRYMLWSGAILIPLFVLVTLIFFRAPAG
jgi:Na+/H+ antiporter NhaD/arsenite permease-like protein